MKSFLIKIVIGVLCLCAGIAVVKYISPREESQEVLQTNNSQPVSAFSKQQEDRKTFALDSSKPIVVSKINGTVQIEYADVTETEVKVTRLANKDEDFGYRKLVLENARRKLEVRMKKSPSLWALLGMIPEERQNVIIRTPRGTKVLMKCINGTVEERETLDGKLEVKTRNYQCSQ